MCLGVFRGIVLIIRSPSLLGFIVETHSHLFIWSDRAVRLLRDAACLNEYETLQLCGGHVLGCRNSCLSI